MNRSTIISIIAIAVLATGSYFYYKHQRSSKYVSYYSSFTKVSGLQESGPVLLHGVKIGKVTDIELGEDRNLHVVYRIKRNITIPVGTIAKVINGDVSGTKAVKLYPGKEKGYMVPGSHIPTIPDTSLVELFNTKITPMIRGSKFLLRTADSTLIDINYLITYGGLGKKAQQEINFFKKDFTGFANTSRDLSKQVESLSKTIEGLDNSIKGINRSDINEKLSSGIRTTKSLSEKDYDSLLKSTAASVTKITRNLKELSNTNKMFTDKATYKDANTQLHAADTSMKELMANPPGIQLIGGGKKKK